MSDLDIFKALLDKTDSSYGVDKPGNDSFEFARDNRTLADPKCTIRVHVMPGYRCHFEAEFDDQGNILNIGQWDEM